MAEYIDLKSILKQGATITDVEVRDGKTYFSVDGYKFCTVGSNVYHENNPVYSSSFLDYIAKREIDDTKEERIEKIEEQQELFEEYKASIYKIIFLRAFEILRDKGEEAFVEYIDHHFFIMEEDDNCQYLIKLLKEK